MKEKKFRIKVVHYSKIIFFIFVLYIASVNAYSLFYVIEGGKPIKISPDSSSRGKIRYFEKVEVLETTMPQITEEPTTLALPDIKIETQQADKEIIKQTPITTAAPTTTPPPTKPPSPKQPPISIDEVLQFSNKLELYELKDGSIIELHISQSQNEVFTIYKQNSRIYVDAVETSNEDIELWMTRSAFNELKLTDDISYTTKRLDGENKIIINQKVSTWTLWRRGYNTLAERLGIM